MFTVEKAGSPEEFVKHHGTKGMKWGIRKSSREFATKYPTGRARAAAINKARVAQQKRYVDYKTETNPAKAKQKKQVFLSHPDRATALRMTRGEKYVHALMATVFAPTVAVPAIVGVDAATRVAIRRNVERKNRR